MSPQRLEIQKHIRVLKGRIAWLELKTANLPGKGGHLHAELDATKCAVKLMEQKLDEL